MSDPVAAITETEATGEVAEIFADIRAVLGVGVVNLIWRHLATIPGALPWAWATVRPLYANGAISAEATALRRELELPGFQAFRPRCFKPQGCKSTIWWLSAACLPLTTGPTPWHSPPYRRS